MKEQIALIIGIIAIVDSFIMFISTDRKKILFFKIIFDILWSTNNFLIGAYTGGFLCALAVFRSIIFSFRGERKWADSIIWLFVFLVLSWSSLIFTYDGWYCVLPVVGTNAAVIAFFIVDTKKTKYFSIIDSVLYLIYAIITINYTYIICRIVMLVSIVIGLINEYRKSSTNI